MNSPLKNAQQFCHYLLEQIIKPGDHVIDATIGNGFDTLFLAKLVTPIGMVYGFDVQEIALLQTKERLGEYNKHCRLFCLGHEHLDTILPEDTPIAGAVFNLGYLPGTDKTIVTKGHHTIQAIQHILKRLKQQGIIAIVVYHGHPGGKEEQQFLLDYVATLSQKEYTVLNYSFLNQQNNPPHLIVIQKR